jgi:hypothetical protein
MTATKALFTAATKIENDCDFRIYFKCGFSKVAKINEGIKSAIVEINVPVNPLLRYAVKVTEEKTGSAVSCHTAIELTRYCVDNNAVTICSIS